MEQISLGLRENKSLHTLNFGSSIMHWVRKPGFESLADALKTNRTLQKLYINVSSSGDDVDKVKACLRDAWKSSDRGDGSTLYLF